MIDYQNLTLLVGKNTFYVSEKAKEFDGNAVLITQENYLNLSKQIKVGYISIEDFQDIEIFKNILLSVKEIFYFPPIEGWKDDSKFTIDNPTSCTRGLLENILIKTHKLKNNFVNIQDIKFLGFDNITNMKSKCLMLEDYRKTDDPQLWIAGCSVSFGYAIDSKFRYANIVANEFNLQLSCLAKPSASNNYQANQILKSDIRKNDIVLWGITVPNRINYLNREVIHVTQTTKTIPDCVIKYNLELENSIYHTIDNILSVKNYCNKIGAKLLLIDVMPWPIYNIYYYNLFDFSEFVGNPYDKFIDFGSDNQHPGPKHHKALADLIIDKLKEL